MRKIFLYGFSIVLSCWLAISPSVVFAGPNPPFYFAATPFSTTKSKATTYAAGVPGLTANKLTAMLIAIAVSETGSAYSYDPPSPMTLSRSDLTSELFPNGINGYHPNAFFHPGIGMWQIDSAGFAVDYGAAEAIQVSTAADAVARQVAKLYGQSGGTDDEKRADAWYDWYACRDKPDCDIVYNLIYNDTNDTFTTNLITNNVAGSNLGGAVWRKCWINGWSSQWDCLQVDPANAEGFKGFTQSNYGPSPLSSRFYVWRGGAENRLWKRQHTGYSTDTDVVRQLDQNARSGMFWYERNTYCTSDAGTCP